MTPIGLICASSEFAQIISIILSLTLHISPSRWHVKVEFVSIIVLSSSIFKFDYLLKSVKPSNGHLKVVGLTPNAIFVSSLPITTVLILNSLCKLGQTTLFSTV